MGHILGVRFVILAVVSMKIAIFCESSVNERYTDMEAKGLEKIEV